MKTILKILSISAALVIIPAQSDAGQNASTFSLEQSGKDVGALSAIIEGCGPEFVSKESTAAIDTITSAFGSMPEFVVAFANSYIDTLNMIRLNPKIMCARLAVTS